MIGEEIPEIAVKTAETLGEGAVKAAEAVGESADKAAEVIPQAATDMAEGIGDAATTPNPDGLLDKLAFVSLGGVKDDDKDEQKASSGDTKVTQIGVVNNADVK